MIRQLKKRNLKKGGSHSHDNVEFVVILQRTAKKCAKICNVQCYCTRYSRLLLSDAPVAVAVVVCLNSLLCEKATRLPSKTASSLIGQRAPERRSHETEQPTASPSDSSHVCCGRSTTCAQAPACRSCGFPARTNKNISYLI